ncbi:hypothetical protein BFN03_17745 [Rhodococcus sp. WMMA185]|uniref:MmpS family transport accessory protein n=1 Tax=Rhodococcus sp. WMMA185 TaxID=679318 RepID=UPI00087876C7|nr:MmpS family transport accessory protein [Rhodococcus sp. WMMA185]AOW93879.1 hypothetical protein BFN03_17745 [Rhodococcus sp. WMMA185]
MAQPGYPQQPPQKKHPVWLWVLIAVVGVVLLGFAGCTALVGVAVKEVNEEVSRTIDVQYEVTSTSDDIRSIRYTSGDSESVEAASVTTPWSETVTISGLVKLATLSVSTGSSGRTVSCTISEGGKVLDSDTASGPYASVYCSKILD